MGTGYTLFCEKGGLVGLEVRDDLEYLHFEVVHEGRAYYTLPTNITNLGLHINKIVKEIMSIQPIGNWSITYISDYGDSGYELAVENGEVHVYDVILEPKRTTRVI